MINQRQISVSGNLWECSYILLFLINHWNCWDGSANAQGQWFQWTNKEVTSHLSQKIISGLGSAKCWATFLDSAEAEQSEPKQNNQSQSRIDLAQGVSRSYFIHWEIESQSQFASDRQTLKIHIKSRNNLYPFITRVSSSLPNHSYYMVKVNRIPFSLSVRDPNTLLMSLFPWGVRKATCGCPAEHRTQSLKNRISLGELRL